MRRRDVTECLGIVGFSSDEDARRDFGPFAPGFDRVPFGDTKALEAAITEDTVASMVEPIQGEVGVVIPPEGYLREARRICSENKVILILDEIQTGLGRTGKMLAEEHEGVEADVTLLGKALSGGFYPVSAVLSHDEFLGVLEPGQHGSTFGGNPLACAVARAALKVIVDEGLVENSALMGERLLARLRLLTGNAVVAARGRGLMTAIDLAPGFMSGRSFCEKLMECGVLAKDTHGQTVRLSPPLVAGVDEVDFLLDAVEKAAR